MAQARRFRLRNSPARYLIGGLAFVTVVMVSAVLAYVALGWSFGDAVYMTILTVYTVGYDEVRPVATPALRAVTIALIVSGCTGMIFVTGALVQVITVAELQRLMGIRRLSTQIERLRDHTVICGFGRIGSMLARELRDGKAPFVIVERGQERFEEARASGYLCLHADATDEDVLRQAGVERARFLATVLPDDAANVYITLSARSLNPDVLVIARGEAPSTERKLRQAGANQVVLPAFIGAERVAELILFPALSGAPGPDMGRQLQRFGVATEVAVVTDGSVYDGLTVGEIEHRAAGAFLIVGIERAGTVHLRPGRDDRVQGGDGVMVLGHMGPGRRAGRLRGPMMWAVHRHRGPQAAILRTVGPGQWLSGLGRRTPGRSEPPRPWVVEART